VTFAPPPASGIATRRIGIANGVLWILATIVLVVVGATTAYQFVVTPYTGGGLFVDPYAYPWEDDEPVVAEEADPNVWSAVGPAVIRLPADRFLQPRRGSIVAGEEMDLYRTNPADADVAPGQRPWPDAIAYLYGDRETYVVPSGGDLELWVMANGPWELRLEPLSVAEVTDVYSGQGDGVVMYRGDAVSAQLSHVGEGVFFVDIYTAFANDTGAIIEVGPVDQRVTWGIDSWVVFAIESDADRGVWTIDIEELARPTSEPSPTPTPTPTETPR
jgi:hypothetical protein